MVAIYKKFSKNFLGIAAALDTPLRLFATIPKNAAATPGSRDGEDTPRPPKRGRQLPRQHHDEPTGKQDGPPTSRPQTAGTGGINQKPGQGKD